MPTKKNDVGDGHDSSTPNSIVRVVNVHLNVVLRPIQFNSI